jgi:hypothetical protein
LNIIAVSSSLGPVIVSAVRSEDGRILTTMERSKKGETRQKFDLKKHLAKKTLTPKEIVQLVNPRLVIKDVKVIRDPLLVRDLEIYENRQIIRSYKFGVLYCTHDQTAEEQMFTNQGGSADWEEFLEFLGDKVVLQGWTKYRAGLDVKSK